MSISVTSKSHSPNNVAFAADKGIVYYARRVMLRHTPLVRDADLCYIQLLNTPYPLQKKTA
jgi:hypothetical protein